MTGLSDIVAGTRSDGLLFLFVSGHHLGCTSINDGGRGPAPRFVDVRNKMSACISPKSSSEAD